jgi:hypothetical protein
LLLKTLQTSIVQKASATSLDDAGLSLKFYSERAIDFPSRRKHEAVLGNKCLKRLFGFVF